MSSPEAVDESAVDPTKLIVNYLPASVTSAALKDLFSPYGTVEEANVVYDRDTKLSKSYGFVKFSTEESAQRAVEGMDGKTLDPKTPDSKPLHVAVSKPPKVPVNLYIGNLLTTVKQEDLTAQFSKFGTIIECSVPLDHASGLGKGYGFVKFDAKTSANEAIDGLDGTVVEALSGSRPLVVKRAENNPGNNSRNRNPRFMNHRYPGPRMMPTPFPPQPMSFDGVCIFIYNIPPQMNERGLQDLFRAYGNVTGARVMRNLNRSSKGYGFVNMATLEEALSAIAGLNGRALIPDKPLQVSLKKQ